MKTEWSAETLEFWNTYGTLHDLLPQLTHYFIRILFGEREEEEPEPKTNREDRFKQLETKLRKKEGLTEIGSQQLRSRPPPAITPPRPRRAQGPSDSGEYPNLTRSDVLTLVFLKNLDHPHPKTWMTKVGSTRY